MSVVPEYTPTMYAVAITVEISPPIPHILMKIENMEMNRTWYCSGDLMKKFKHILQYQLDLFVCINTCRLESSFFF